jgi:hypothetical protein
VVSHDRLAMIEMPLLRVLLTPKEKGKR